MRFATINGITLHYARAGDETKPTLIFANSLGTDFRIWRAVAANLVADFDLVLYDKRGHGLSESPPLPYGMSDHVRDLVSLMDHLGIEDAVLCGVSVGGMIAQGVAAIRPDAIRGLVLCNTAPRIGPPQMWDARIASIQRGGIDAVADGIMENWFSAGFRQREGDQVAGYRNMVVRTPITGYLGTCIAIREADYSVTTPLLRMPVLCVGGAEDGATPAEMVRTMADNIPQARFELIQQCGHLPSVEQPEILANLVSRFTGQHGLQ